MAILDYFFVCFGMCVILKIFILGNFISWFAPRFWPPRCPLPLWWLCHWWGMLEIVVLKPCHLPKQYQSRQKIQNLRFLCIIRWKEMVNWDLDFQNLRWWKSQMISSLLLPLSLCVFIHWYYPIEYGEKVGYDRNFDGSVLWMIIMY